MPQDIWPNKPDCKPPQFNNFTHSDNLRYWCFKILPLVYDDSLSYYELLCKISALLNQVIDNMNLLPDFIAELIKNYITSGDILPIIRDFLSQHIINVKAPPNKLDPATGDGTQVDTTAIQGCIDYAHAQGGAVIWFPTGSYLTDSLTIYDNISLIGGDRYTTRLVLRGGGKTALIHSPTPVNGINIRNLTLQANIDMQVNNVDIINLIISDMLLNNVILDNGYHCLQLTPNGGHIQLDNIICDNAVVSFIKINAPEAQTSIQCDNLTLNQLSQSRGVFGIEIASPDVQLTNLQTTSVYPTVFNITGSGCYIIGNVANTSNFYNNSITEGYIYLNKRIILDKMPNGSRNATYNQDTTTATNITRYATKTLANNAATITNTATNRTANITNTDSVESQTITHTSTNRDINVRDAYTITSDTINVTANDLISDITDCEIHGDHLLNTYTNVDSQNVTHNTTATTKVDINSPNITLRGASTNLSSQATNVSGSNLIVNSNSTNFNGNNLTINTNDPFNYTKPQTTLSQRWSTIPFLSNNTPANLIVKGDYPRDDNVVNLLDFGSAVNGDWSVAFAAMIRYASQHRYWCYIPPGSYTINTPYSANTATYLYLRSNHARLTCPNGLLDINALLTGVLQDVDITAQNTATIIAAKYVNNFVVNSCLINVANIFIDLKSTAAQNATQLKITHCHFINANSVIKGSYVTYTMLTDTIITGSVSALSGDHWQVGMCQNLSFRSCTKPFSLTASTMISFEGCVSYACVYGIYIDNSPLLIDNWTIICGTNSIACISCNNTDSAVIDNIKIKGKSNVIIISFNQEIKNNYIKINSIGLDAGQTSMQAFEWNHTRLIHNNVNMLLNTSSVTATIPLFVESNTFNINNQNNVNYAQQTNKNNVENQNEGQTVYVLPNNATISNFVSTVPGRIIILKCATSFTIQGSSTIDLDRVHTIPANYSLVLTSNGSKWIPLNMPT